MEAARCTHHRLQITCFNSVIHLSLFPPTGRIVWKVEGNAHFRHIAVAVYDARYDMDFFILHSSWVWWALCLLVIDHSIFSELCSLCQNISPPHCCASNAMLHALIDILLSYLSVWRCGVFSTFSAFSLSHFPHSCHSIRSRLQWWWWENLLSDETSVQQRLSIGSVRLPICFPIAHFYQHLLVDVVEITWRQSDVKYYQQFVLYFEIKPMDCWINCELIVWFIF